MIEADGHTDNVVGGKLNYRMFGIWLKLSVPETSSHTQHAINQLWIKFEDSTPSFYLTFFRFLEAVFPTRISCNSKNANLFCKFFSLNILEDLSLGSLKLLDGYWYDSCILGWWEETCLATLDCQS